MTDEPQTYDEAVERVHRAFCDPKHELVGPWDQEMADALKRNGYAIVRAAQEAPATEGLRPALAEYLAWLRRWVDEHPEHTLGWVKASALRAALAATPPTPVEPPNPWPVLEAEPTFREGMAKAAVEHERGEFTPVVHRAPEGLRADQIERIAVAMNGRISPDDILLGRDLRKPAERLYDAGLRAIE